MGEGLFAFDLLGMRMRETYGPHKLCEGVFVVTSEQHFQRGRVKKMLKLNVFKNMSEVKDFFAARQDEFDVLVTKGAHDPSSEVLRLAPG